MIIRDAVLDDVRGCAALDHRYETDHVWQMQVRQEDGWQIVFRSERLPRTLEGKPSPDVSRLQSALTPDHCFLVASDRSSGDMLGYLTMQRDGLMRVGHIQDFAVDAEARRCGIGKRLLTVAINWAKEHQIIRIQAAIQTTNYPASAFLQEQGFVFCGFNEFYFPNRDIALFFSQAVR
ncbi:MAG: GNAT family N-acetyltransferase [Anaerolineae bacterium]|nr:GNAT family N-acetyltransferase [Anaerolineae bacterium]